MKIKKLNNVEELLVPSGTKVVYHDWTDEKMIGIVDGNDLDGMDEDDDFEDINYYIIPLEYIDDEEREKASKPPLVLCPKKY